MESARPSWRTTARLPRYAEPTPATPSRMNLTTTTTSRPMADMYSIHSSRMRSHFRTRHLQLHFHRKPQTHKVGPLFCILWPSSSLTLRAAALAVFKKTYPQYAVQPQRPGNLYTYLGSQPVQRIPHATPRFNNLKPQNAVAFFMQAIGDMVPMDAACDRCSRNTGVFPHNCVVVRDPAVLEVTGGACANCWYSRQGSLCTFRQSTPNSDPAVVLAKHMRIKPPPGPPRPPQQTPRPPQDPVPPAPAPIHPSYAAALAAGAVAANPAPTVASGTPAAKSKPKHLSRDEKVRVWENRYGTMSTDSLLSAHEHLVEWQEDLATRLLAMNRVVLERLLKRGG